MFLDSLCLVWLSSEASVRHLHRSEDGLGVDLVVTAATLIVEDLLRVRLSAQQLQLAQRHFRHTGEPLNHRLLLRPALWNTARHDGQRRVLEDESSETSVTSLTVTEQFDHFGHVRVVFIVPLDQDVLAGADDGRPRETLHTDGQRAEAQTDRRDVSFQRKTLELHHKIQIWSSVTHDGLKSVS